MAGWGWAAIASTMLVGMGAGAGAAWGQFAPPAAQTPTGVQLFARNCAVCHSVVAGEASRQGPSLVGVVGRKAGSVPGFRYSAGFAKADWVWDEARLDAFLADPQAMIPGAVMPYKQPRAEIRAAIVGYLKEVR